MADLNYVIDPVTHTVTVEVDSNHIVIPPTDTTLTVTGKAADAKATGDAIGNLDESKADQSDVDALESKFDIISVPVDSDGFIPVGSTEHAILIITSGWTLAINGYAWVCAGYATGSNRKNVFNIGSTGNIVTCTASDTGYVIHNGGNSSVSVNVMYLRND